MDLSELMITRSEELGITQKGIVDKTHEPECAQMGGRRLSAALVSQLRNNRPRKILLPEPSTVYALAYALETTPFAIYLAALHTIGVWKSEGPGGMRVLTVGTNGFSFDQMQRIVHTGLLAMAHEAECITQMEQPEGV